MRNLLQAHDVIISINSYTFYFSIKYRVPITDMPQIIIVEVVKKGMLRTSSRPQKLRKCHGGGGAHTAL